MTNALVAIEALVNDAINVLMHSLAERLHHILSLLDTDVIEVTNYTREVIFGEHESCINELVVLAVVITFYVLF